MATRIIELSNRVFEMTLTPDGPGYCKRTLSLRQLSGPDLTEREAATAIAAVIAHLERLGANNVRVREE